MTPPIIDPGHGGHDSGAVSGDGSLLEKDVVLAVAKEVGRILEASLSVKVPMTRVDDRFLTLGRRAALANNLKAPLLSIHANAGGGHGIEVFTSPGQTESDSWATDVLDSMAKEFPNRRIRSDFRDGDADKEARFTVLTKTSKPAILVELGFIDTREGQTFLGYHKNQKRLAESIALGTLKWLGVTATPPKSAPTPAPVSVDNRTDRLADLERRVAALESRF